MAKKREIKTFEDFQERKEEMLQKQAMIKEEKESEEFISYPEIFAKESPDWIKNGRV